MLNKAHDAATNKGAAITIKRVSISDNPFEILKLNTLYIIIKNNSIKLLIEILNYLLIYNIYVTILIISFKV